jgi:hypothetical protein
VERWIRSEINGRGSSPPPRQSAARPSPNGGGEGLQGAYRTPADGGEAGKRTRRLGEGLGDERQLLGRLLASPPSSRPPPAAAAWWLLYCPPGSSSGLRDGAVRVASERGEGWGALRRWDRALLI